MNLESNTTSKINEQCLKNFIIVEAIMKCICMYDSCLRFINSTIDNLYYLCPGPQYVAIYIHTIKFLTY